MSEQFRHGGDSGLVVSVAGLGCDNLGMKLDAEQSRDVVFAALDEGVTIFDTADCYGASEERLGHLLKGRRGDVAVASRAASGSARSRRGTTRFPTTVRSGSCWRRQAGIPTGRRTCTSSSPRPGTGR